MRTMRTKQDARRKAQGGETLLRPWRDSPVSQIAARIGRSKSHVWRVLKGQRKPGRELAAAIASMGLEVEGR